MLVVQDLMLGDMVLKSRSSRPTATASSLYENDSGTYKFTEKDLDVRAFTFKISYSSTAEVI